MHLHKTTISTKYVADSDNSPLSYVDGGCKSVLIGDKDTQYSRELSNHSELKKEIDWLLNTSLQFGSQKNVTTIYRMVSSSRVTCHDPDYIKQYSHRLTFDIALSSAVQTRAQLEMRWSYVEDHNMLFDCIHKVNAKLGRIYRMTMQCQSSWHRIINDHTHQALAASRYGENINDRTPSNIIMALTNIKHNYRLGSEEGIMFAEEAYVPLSGQHGPELLICRIQLLF